MFWVWPLNNFVYFNVLELVGQLCHSTLTLADRRGQLIVNQARHFMTFRIFYVLELAGQLCHLTLTLTGADTIL